MDALYNAICFSSEVRTFVDVRYDYILTNVERTMLVRCEHVAHDRQRNDVI